MLIKKREANLNAKRDAFRFQVEAVEAVKNLEYAALFHEQGLGKTKIGLDLALTWLKRDLVDSVFIVTKRSLIANWTKEIKDHTFLNPRILDQKRAANFYAFNSPARLYLTHYEVLKSEERRIALFQKTRRVAIILDEAQKLKNPDSDLAKSLHNLAKGFSRRVIMTGTPIANRPYDIWSQIYFLDEGRSLGNSFQEFRRNLDLRNELAEDHNARNAFEQELGTIFDRIRAFSVRETKNSAGIELPEKIIENITIDLEPTQRSLYDSFRIDLGAQVVRDGVLTQDDAEEALKRLLRLVQIASNPKLVDDSYKKEPGKLAAARQLVGRAIGEGSKAIVWTNFVENADWLKSALSDFGSVVVHGSRTISERNDAVESFKSNSAIRVLVATPGSAKEGLTLTVANHAIFYDRSFSLDDYLQAQDRIHRISQNRSCYIWNLVARNTIDEWVDSLLAAKHLAAQLGQGDIDSAEYSERANYDFAIMVREILGLGRED